MKKAKRFDEGGIADKNFTADQLKFLGGVDGVGGADRTDPYILARMRSKFPDAPKETVKETPQKEVFYTKEGRNENIKDEALRARAMRSVMLDDSPAGKTGFGEENELPTIATKLRKPVAVKAEKKEVVAEKPKDEPKKTENKNPQDNFPRIALPKSFSASGGNKEPKISTAKLSSLNVRLPKAFSKINNLRGSNKDLAYNEAGFKKGGVVKSSSASKRADGCAVRGKTRA